MACDNCKNKNRSYNDYQFRNCKSFNVQMRIVQFNDLPLNNISDFEWESEGRINSIEYHADNGNYFQLQADPLYREPIEFSVDLEFPFNKVQKMQAKTYKDFIDNNLNKAGKLWFVEAGRLYWAFAIPVNVSKRYRTDYHYKMLYKTVNFLIPSGLLYSADIFRTFLLPYDKCDFLSEIAYDTGGQCTCNGWFDKPCPTCVQCEELTEENLICENLHRLDDIFDNQCEYPYKILYNCEKSKEIFECDELWGDKFCFCDCIDKLYDSFTSDTMIPTKWVTIRLVGHFLNPTVTLNNAKISFTGEYHGTIIIKNSTDITYIPQCFECECAEQKDECAVDCYLWENDLPILDNCEDTSEPCEPIFDKVKLDLRNIEFESCNSHLFRVINGHNKLMVTGDISGDNQCSYVYVEHQRLFI